MEAGEIAANWIDSKHLNDDMKRKMLVIIATFPISEFSDDDPRKVLRKAYTLAHQGEKSEL